MSIFQAKVEAAADGSEWIEIASGTFQPGAEDPLQLVGEQFPGSICGDFLATITEAGNGGNWETKVGKCNYRILWTR